MREKRAKTLREKRSKKSDNEKGAHTNYKERDGNGVIQGNTRVVLGNGEVDIEREEVIAIEK